MLYFLLTFPRTKLTVVLLWILLVSVYPLNKLGTFPPLTSVLSQDLALQQGMSAANSICRSPDVFNKHTISLRILFPLFNTVKIAVPVTSLACYLYCFIIEYLVISLILYSSGFSLALVMYTFSARLL
jgi:hypothetical protein